MTADRRYQLLPQMQVYDNLASPSAPYVMFTNDTNFRSSNCNTDEHGFRYTWSKEGWLDYGQFQNKEDTNGCFFGGSTIFGVGASHDCKTIPSMVNSQSDPTWFNFGNRAFNSTQEALHHEL